MSSETTSIVVISDDLALSTNVCEQLRSMPDMTVEARTGTLAGMNGMGVSLAAAHSVLIFKTTGSSEADIGAVANLRRELDRSAIVFAMTDTDISLADARRLIRAGVDEVLSYPVSSEELLDHVQRWTRSSPLMLLPDTADHGRRAGKIITVARARGGIGATTLAVNLADRLVNRAGLFRKRTANKVALIDFDFQFGAIASFLDLEAKDTLFRMATEGIRPDARFLSQSMSNSAGGISVLTAPGRFAPLDALKSDQIALILDLLRADFDYIVVDLPQALVDWLSPILERTNQLLLVTDSTVPSIRQARRLIDFYTEENPGLLIEIVVNHEKKPLLGGSAQAEAKKVLERPLKFWLPHDPGAARAAVDRGVPLSVVSSRSPLAKAVNALGRASMAALTLPVQASAAPK